jgi:hypothetical protein
MTVATRLFKRGCRVTAYNSAPATTGFVGSNPQFFQPQPNGLVIENLRVQFKIEKSLEKTPNTCELTITNCSARTRSFLQTKPLTVKIEAGYDNDLRFIFIGDLRYGYSHVVDSDWETVLLLADGDRAYRYARASRSYPKGTNVVTALRDCAATMGLQLTSDVAASNDLQAQFATGRTLTGPTRDELTRLLAPYGYHWSIQDSQLQILKDQNAAPGTAFLISQATGLIKSPEYAVPEKATKPTQIKTETLLYPALIPGALIDVESLQVSSLFRINKLVHNGDTHGDAWTTECESIVHQGLVAA